MNKNRFKTLFLLVTLILVLFPVTKVQAKVQSFTGLYTEVTLPEDTIVLTPETSNIDPLWNEIGIMDPAAEKKSMKEMSVQAIFYDPSSGATVRLLSKHTRDSEEVYNFSLLSEDEFTAYLDRIFSTTEESTTYTIEKYEQAELPFYRLELHFSKDGTEYSEIIYGTIVNGYSISYDIYAKNNKEPLDESFLEEVVSGTHFTKLLDKAEVKQQQQRALTYFMGAIVIFILFLVAVFILRRRMNKKEALKKKDRTEALSRFFIAQRQREEQNMKDTPVFSNRTKYSEDLIKTFYTYDRIWKRIRFWIATVIILLLLLASFYSTGSIYVCIIAIGLAVVFVYQYYTQTEKAIMREVKAYKSNKGSEAVFTFFDDYYTLSGIQSSSKYPYIQATEIKEYKEYIYIYLGSERAHYLSKDGFEHGLEEFKTFMKDKMDRKQ